MTLRHPVASACLTLGLFLAFPAHAQDVPQPRSYTPADFARSAPHNALELLEQVPGFVIEASDTDRRGLGQATGNVLLNGQRIIGKSTDISAELARVNIANVVRVEIVDGATLKVPGLSGPVANIITVSTGTVGNFAWRPEYRFRTGQVRLANGELALTGRMGRAEYTLSARNDSVWFGSTGPELVFDSAGQITDRRSERAVGRTEKPTLRGSVNVPFDNRAVLNLSAVGSLNIYDWTETSLRKGPGMPDRLRTATERTHARTYELGGDYEFDAAKGRLKVIGLYRSTISPFGQLVTQIFSDSRPASGDRYESRSDTSETIARAEYRRHALGGDWQVSIEGALNRLAIDNRASSADATGIYNSVPLADASATVEERRAEASISYARSVTTKLDIQATLATEYSILSQLGAGGVTRRFVRPKGLISLAWKPRAGLDVSLRVERVVGQLDFADFVASADFNGGTSNAANVYLVPPQSWNGELRATRTLNRLGTISVRLYTRQISDVVDIVPIGATGQAPGNLDSAQTYGIQTIATLKLDPLGVAGAKIDVDLNVENSGVRDPLTGRRRPISNELIRSLSIAFRHEIPRSDWVYGGKYTSTKAADDFRLDLIAMSSAPARFGIYVERKNVLGMTVRASLDNVLDARDRFSRIFYAGRRTNGARFTEDRYRRTGVVVGLALSGKL